MTNTSNKPDHSINLDKVNFVLKLSTLMAFLGGVWLVAQKSATLDQIGSDVKEIKGKLDKKDAIDTQQSTDIATLKGKLGVN